MNGFTFDKLDDVFQSCTNNLDGKCDPSEIIPLIQNEFMSYPEAIRDFFAGKQDEIKMIYKALRNHEYPYNKVSVIDVLHARTMYIEYLQGLQEFMQKLLDLRDDDGIDTNIICDNLERMVERNGNYVISIFGGEENPRTDVSLDEAMKNVETFIDFSDDITILSTKVMDVLALMRANKSEAYKDCISRGVTSLYIQSIRNYIYNFSKAILECYNAIHDSMRNRTPVSGETTTPKYQLF